MSGYDDHGARGHADDAEDDVHDQALGPIDVEAWGAGILGVVIAVAVAVCFALSTGRLA